MKILLVSPWLPWPPFGGGLIRILETLHFLSRHHRITLVAPVRRGETVGTDSPLWDVCERIETASLAPGAKGELGRILRGTCQGLSSMEAVYWHPDLARHIRDLTRAEDFDIVQIEFSYMAHYRQAVSPTSHAKTVLSMHNVESIRFARELQFAPWGKRRVGLLWDHYLFRLWEQKAIRSFDGILATSNMERDWIQAQAPEAAVSLMPNGVNVSHFQNMPASAKTRSIVFTGLMNYPPNVDAVMWFCHDVWPTLRQHIPDLQFNIVGRSPQPKVVALGRQPGVHVTGEVPDTRPYVTEALALVVPLRSGGGTRLKILEAMAMGCPVISTRLGAEGLDVVNGESILLADRPDELVQQVQLLLQDATLACRIGQAGQRLVAKQYDWQVCLRGVEQLYDTLIGSRIV